ncbi:hypothetical protein ACQJBY_006439 [Aegilops geniculata]
MDAAAVPSDGSSSRWWMRAGADRYALSRSRGALRALGRSRCAAALLLAGGRHVAVARAGWRWPEEGSGGWRQEALRCGVHRRRRAGSRLHVEDLPLLRSVPIRAGTGPWRRLRRPLWAAWRIWRAGEVPGETPGWRRSLPKVDAFGADPLPEGFGVDPLPSASSSSYGESFCSPCMGVDGTLVS